MVCQCSGHVSENAIKQFGSLQSVIKRADIKRISHPQLAAFHYIILKVKYECTQVESKCVEALFVLFSCTLGARANATCCLQLFRNGNGGLCSLLIIAHEYILSHKHV